MSPNEGCGAPLDGARLGTLYEAERNRVFAVCFALLRNPQDAEDATQETFARVMARARRLDGDARAYLVATARNVCVDELRRRNRRREGEIDDESAAGASSSVETAEDTAVARGMVSLAWHRLPERDRRLFAYVFAGLSLSEIGSRVDMTSNLVGLRLFRARQRLRRFMPAPGVAAAVRPRVLWQALLRRLRRERGDAMAPLMTRLQESAVGVAPVLLSVLSGTGGGGAPAIALPPPALARPVAAGPVSGLPHRPLGTLSQAVQSAAATATAVAAPLAANGPAYLSSFVPSPNYSRDHTVFAEGPNQQQCSSNAAVCFSLYRTADGGRDWTLVSPAFNGQLLLPPFFATSSTLYALTSDGLARSDNGGRTFELINTVLDTARSLSDGAGSTMSSVATLLPAPLASPLDNAEHYRELANGATSTVQGDVAAIEPDSRPDHTVIFVVNREANTLSVYDSRNHSVNPAFRVAPDQTDVLDAVSAPGAGGVFVVAQTVSQGWSVFSCTAGGGCARLGPAPEVLHQFDQDRVASPTFGRDHTFWYEGWLDVEQVTLGGADVHLALPAGWVPLVVLPGGNYAATRDVEVIAALGDQPDSYAVMDSRGGAAFRLVQRIDMPAGVDVFTMVRMPDGSLYGTRWPWDESPGGFVCSRDGGITWRASC